MTDMIYAEQPSGEGRRIAPPISGAETNVAERSNRAFPKRLWPELFVERYFMMMPSPVRVVVYLLIVFTYLHNSLQEAPLTGQLWIRQADGTEVQGELFGAHATDGIPHQRRGILDAT